MAIDTAIITTTEAAVKAQAEAQRKRSVAKALAKDGDSTGARFALAEAADLDRAAAASLDPSNALLDPLGAGAGRTGGADEREHDGTPRPGGHGQELMQTRHDSESTRRNDC